MKAEANERTHERHISHADGQRRAAGVSRLNSRAFSIIGRRFAVRVIAEYSESRCPASARAVFVNGPIVRFGLSALNANPPAGKEVHDSKRCSIASRTTFTFSK